MDEVDQRGNHVLGQELARRNQRRSHLQIVVALKVLWVRRMGETHHLQAVDDHEAELVLGGNAESRGDVSRLFVDYIGIGAKLPSHTHTTSTSMALR